ncbi:MULTISPECIES: TonB-dependent receptor [unclassified Sphingomonas]|uniref:TonB-dependent receptor n=2 Tax=Pseudomonadota TaxID=1224 RepID=UPI000E72D9EF|nr:MULTISPECIES: TonB-dependent receptor [unclassified Sphingomonas]RKE50576.1 TonB-dependent receptor [Sphingomonas sp. PP-CC-1A-547]TCM08871.1 TonB-dependent receptor [Sphingomonas sp. PP-CC-3G-468]
MRKFSRTLAHSVSTIAVVTGLAASSTAIAQTTTAATGQSTRTTTVQQTVPDTVPAASTPDDAAAGPANEIVVTGIRASLNRAIDIKRNSAGVVDAISAEDIGKFPDTNLAESLQRITGVSITRANGEGSQVAVRGFSGGFNLVTLNGRQLASTSIDTSTGNAFAVGTGRSFDFQNLASEGVATLEVYKTGRANIPTGGIGAAINVITRRPLDAREDGLSGSIGAKALYDSSVENAEANLKKVTPELSGLINWKNPSETFGVNVFGSYQLRESTSIQSNPNYWNIVPLADFLNTAGAYITPTTNITNRPTTQYVQIPNDSRYQFSENRRERINGQANIQFKPTDRLEITIDGLYARNKLSDERSEQTNWFQRPFSDVTFDDNKKMQTAIILAEAKQADKGYEQQRFATKTELYSVGGNLKWNFTDVLSLKLDANHSKSTTNPDNANGTSATTISIGAPVRATHKVDFSSGFPQQSETLNDCNATNGGRGGNCNNILDIGDLGTQVARRIFSKQESRVNQFSGELGWDLGNDSRFVVGSNYVDATTRSASSNNQQILGDWSITDTGRVQELAGDLVKTYCMTCKFDKYNPNSTGSALVAFRGDAVELLDIFSPYYAKLGRPDALQGSSDDTVGEKNLAVYGQMAWGGDIGGRRANALIGVRYERTRVKSVSLQSIPTALAWQSDNDFTVIGGPPGAAVIAKSKYDNLLPSLDFNIEVLDNVMARTSFSRTLARADYGNLFASVTANAPNRPTALGAAPAPATRQDPALLPLISDNFDVSLEWYYKPTSFVSVGFFNKNVRNFVGNQITNGNLFGLRDPGSGAPGSRSGIAQAFLRNNGITQTDRNLFAYAALLQQNGGNQAATTAAFRGALNPATGEISDAVYNPLALAVDLVGDANDPLVNFAISGPVNNKEGNIHGFEVAWTNFFGQTGFGFAVSYTKVSGDVNVDPYADPNVNIFALSGLGDSANLTAIYDKGGISARVSYNWRDKYLAATNQGGNRNPLFTAAFGTLDGSISYDVTKAFSVSLEAVNLTSEPFRQYARTETNLVYVQELKPRYYLGARYRF